MVRVKCTTCGCSGRARVSSDDPETGTIELYDDSIEWDDDYMGDCNHEEYEIKEDIPEDYDYDI
jgi:hypothetical protein